MAVRALVRAGEVALVLLASPPAGSPAPADTALAARAGTGSRALKEIKIVSPKSGESVQLDTHPEKILLHPKN